MEDNQQIVFSTNNDEKYWISIYKKRVIDLNVRPKTTKFLDKNIGEKSF